MNNTVTRQVLGKVAMTSRGEYDTSKSYEILDIVTYQGSSYLSKKYNNDSLPTNADDWQLLAQKGDTYELSEEDLQRIAEQITSNANSAFNQNVKEKTDGFNSNANSKTEAYNTNATEKTNTYNSNHTAKLKEYNDNATSKLSAYNTNTETKTTEYNSNHTSKINAYNTNASNKVDVYNTNADTKLEEYNTNANTKINEYDEHSKELNNKIVSTRNELERLKSNVLNTGEDTDTFIHLEDSAMAELQEIKVDGVCGQKTTTGKNLLESNFLPITKNGITISENDNGDIVVNGTITGIESGFEKFYIGKSFTVEEGTYTSSVQNKRVGIGLNTSGFNGELNITMADNVNFKTATSTKTNIISPQVNIRYDAGTFDNFILNPMLEKSSNATEYEPFTNGASPNPDYPQEIKTITDSLKVTSCNKNVFKITSTLKHHIASGVDISINDNVITLNGTATGVMWPDFIWGIQTNTVIHNKCKYYFSEQSEDCIASINVLSGKATGGAFIIIANDDGSSTFGLNFSNLQNTKTFKANGVNRAYLSGITNGTKFDNFTFEIMLEKGSVATAFERRVESQIQAKLPEGEFIGYINATNYDILSTKYNRNAAVYQWVLNKCIAKITIDGTKGSFSMPSVGRFNIDNIISNYLKTSQSYGITTKCDNYISFPQTLSNSDFDKLTSGYNYGIGLDGGTANNIRIKNVNFSNVEDFKNDLKQHPITLYYILNIESRQTLDLDVTDMLMSYKDITNIFTDSDLLPTINAKYYRVFDKTIQNAQINEKTLKQEITDLNATVSALDTRLKELETKSVEEPTESEGTV